MFLQAHLCLPVRVDDDVRVRQAEPVGFRQPARLHHPNFYASVLGALPGVVCGMKRLSTAETIEENGGNYNNCLVKCYVHIYLQNQVILVQHEAAWYQLKNGEVHEHATGFQAWTKQQTISD